MYSAHIYFINETNSLLAKELQNLDFDFNRSITSED